jgi:transposase
MLLRHYLEQGVSKSALARKLGISRDTIYRWIRSGELERDLDAEPVRYKRRPPAPHKLDPYKPMILARLAAYPKLSAIRLFEEVRAAGYPGGYTRLKDYVREVRPRPLPEPVVRFETPPAQQAQVDFAQVRLPWGVRYGLLVVLGYSRLLWVRFYARQDMRTLFLGLEAAFRFFGGVPREILFDHTPSPNWSGHLGEVMLNLFEEEENGGISQGRRWAPAVHDRLQEGADRPRPPGRDYAFGACA